MKKIILQAVMLVFAAMTAMAQAPEQFNYQGIARDASGNPLASTAISLRLTILNGSSSGTTLYQETFAVTTNAYGLYNVSVGGGTVVSGTFSSINWGSGSKYLQVEIDPSGGSSYTMAGANQLLSVPYSLYATNAATAASAASLTGTVTMGGDVTGTNAAATVVKLQGKSISATAPTSGQVLEWNSGTSSWTPTALGTGGTVTSIATTAPITGGPITTSGTIGLATTGTAGTYGSATQVPVFMTDAYGRVTGVTNTSITGLISGGTANYLPKFTSATAIGNSTIYQNGSNYGLGTTTPRALVEGTTTDTMAGWFYTTSTPAVAHGILESDLNSTASTTCYGIFGNAYNVASNNASIGVEGYGTALGIEGVGISTTTTGSARGGDAGAYCDGAYAMGLGGYGNNDVGTPTTTYGIVGNAVGGSTNYSGYFFGDVYIGGTLSGSGKLFKIDHPLDPDNKYLVHSCVESNEMMNIYTGNVTTDASGNATVTLPDYFEALNTDFRYQLTVVGTFAQAIISEKVNSNKFSIKTNAPNVEVSWQITAVRHDAYANAHPLIPEMPKESFNRGKYLDPKDLGKSPTDLIGYDASKPASPKPMHTTLENMKKQQ